ncbi:MAG TPA: hypothetical protein VFJ58_22415 [Armatimonadota bacterium]|nr:hypothetical protein [Armatimonadota bacterium]
MPKTLQRAEPAANGRKRQRRALPTLLESLPPAIAIILEWLMRIAGIVAVAAIAYYTYALAQGGVTKLWNQSLQDQWHIIHNLELAGTLLVLSGCYLAFYAFLAWYEHTDWFLGLVFIFAALVFGAHFLIYNQMRVDPRNMAAVEILYYLQVVGEACLSVATFRFFCYVVALMKHGLPDAVARSGMKLRMEAGHERSRVKPATHIWRRCWETPYCQDFLLAVCSAWQRQKTCWKYGSGCMCDPSMMERLIQIEMIPLGAPDRNTGPAGTAPKGMAKCRRCPIYLEHEEEKYRVISPLVPVITLLAVILGWNWLATEYQTFAIWIGHLIAQVALGPTQALAHEWTWTFLDPFVKYSLMACGAVALLSYLLKFTEWAILEKKL